MVVNPGMSAAACIGGSRAHLNADAVHKLLASHGLSEHEGRLRELGATAVVHLMQLTADDLAAELPGLTECQLRAFETMLGRRAPDRIPSEKELVQALEIENRLRTSVRCCAAGQPGLRCHAADLAANSAASSSDLRHRDLAKVDDATPSGRAFEALVFLAGGWAGGVRGG